MNQIPDDPSLLRLMMEDMSSADELYRPTSYWQYYVDRFSEELSNSGLTDLRRRRGSWAGSFGATDLLPVSLELDFNRIRVVSNKVTRRIPGWQSALQRAGRAMSHLLARLPHELPYAATVEDIQRLTFQSVHLNALKRGAREPTEIGCAPHGSPEDAFQIGEHIYTMQFLKFFDRYTFAAQHVSFDKIGTVAELGPGTGQQVEILAKLYPHLAILLFDIPPMLYVAEQYLGAVFKERVVSYRRTRSLPADFKIESGKIYFFGSWHMPYLAHHDIDLFWNARSLGEMEPGVARNYLRLAAVRTKWIYLNQVLGGQNRGAGYGPRVKERVTWDDYGSILDSAYLCLERVPALTPARPTMAIRKHNAYSDEAVFRRRATMTDDNPSHVTRNAGAI